MQTHGNSESSFAREVYISASLFKKKKKNTKENMVLSHLPQQLVEF